MDKPTWLKRRLGRTEMSVTPVGIGGAYLGSSGEKIDREVGVATVLRGLELGLNVIDTSAVYLGGESERIVGLALEEWYARGGRREEIVLSTKTGTRDRAHDYSYDHTMWSVQISLERLKTDYLDILLVHDPHDIEPVLAPRGALDALKELKVQGVIRAIGLGCRPHAFHQRLIETGELDMSLTFNDYNLLHKTAAEDVLEPATARDVGVYNASVNLRGLLGGHDPVALLAERWPPERRADIPEHRREAIEDEARRARALWEWCQAREVSLLALNLQYCLREPRVACTLLGFSRPSRVDEDIAACFEPIPDEVWRELPAVLAEVQI